MFRISKSADYQYIHNIYKIGVGNRGVALMMILWVLILLDIIVLQFASSMRTELEITKNFKDTLEAYYIARAAVEVAKFELNYVAGQSRVHGRNKEGIVDFIPDLADRDANPIWQRQQKFAAGVYNIEYYVKEEKYDLNYLATRRNERELKDILVTCGVEPESAELSEIMSSIMDWVDNDDELFAGSVGAEKDWYLDNPHPGGIKYECKNDRFYSVEELALIRGLRPEDGDSEDEKAHKAKILKALYDRVDADPFRIITKRNENFLDCNSLIEEFGEDKGLQMCEQQERAGYIINKRPSFYEVIATGWIKGGLAKRQIKAEFDIRRPKDVKLISWTDNYIPFEEQAATEEPTEDEQI